MVTKSTSKKTVAKKAPMKKKAVAKKGTPQTNVKATNTAKSAVVKTETVAQKAVSVPAAPKTKKVYEISTFFYAMIVLMVVILYAQLAGLAVLYFNYEVTIESKASIEARQYRFQQQRKMEVMHWVKERTNAARERAEIAKKRPSVKCPAPVDRKVAFNEAEYAPYAGEGNAVIAGKTCFVLADGSEKCFEGVDVFINPVTSYSDEWYNRGWAGREFLKQADARAIGFNKMIKSGKNGAFEFKGLKPGSYYVGTAVCLPEAKDAKRCHFARFAAKVKMKNRIQPSFKKVFP